MLNYKFPAFVTFFWSGGSRTVNELHIDEGVNSVTLSAVNQKDGKVSRAVGIMVDKSDIPEIIKQLQKLTP